jgi:hypothetical protein
MMNGVDLTLRAKVGQSGRVLVFEIRGDSTNPFGKPRKNGATPSSQLHVLPEQDAVAAMVFVRKDSDVAAKTLTANDALEMPETDVEAPAFYRGVDLADEGAVTAR